MADPVSPGAALVDVEDLSLFLPGDARHVHVLHHIGLHLRRGEHHLITGGNGAGKTTLLRLLHGELWPAEGRIVWHTSEGAETSPIAGRSISALVSPGWQDRCQRMGWGLSGREFILTGFQDTDLPYEETSEEQEAAAEDMARRLESADLLDRPLPELSQGQLRILLLARALVRRPPLLLLDECLDGLDARRRRAFLDALEPLALEGGVTVVMSDHRPGRAPGWCAGRKRMDAGFLLPAPPDDPAGGQDVGDGASGPVPARDVQPAPDPDAPPLVIVRDADVYIEGTPVLHGLNWTLRRGEHWRVDGENGSGKSTFLRMLAGDEFVAAGGSVTRILPGGGGETALLSDIRRGIRLVSDLSQARYEFDLTGLELVCSGYDNSIGLYREFSQEEIAGARRLMEEMEAAHLADASIRRISTGQLRRLFLARALAGGPDILLLDEPCSGLDAAARTRYLRLLDGIADRGVSLVLVSHEEGDGPSCLNRLARMTAGRLEILE